MDEFLAFGVLGLGLGAVFTLLGQSIVLVHRGSGVLNFAAGAIGMFGAYVYYKLDLSAGWPWPLAMAVALVSAAAIGCLMHLVVLRRLWHASVTAKIVATLGLMTILMAIANLAFAPNGLTTSVPSLLPNSTVHLTGTSSVGLNQILLAVIGVVLTGGLVAMQRFTRFGLATSAVAENPLVASSMGWSPDVVATATWALGSAIAAFGTILIAPITGMSVETLTLLVIPALAAALVGRFESFLMTLLGAMLIGVAESEVSWYVRSPGWTEAAPLIVIVLVLGAQGRLLPSRSDTRQRLASVGPGKVGMAGIIWFALGLALVLMISETWLSAVTTSLVTAVLVLSVVVVTGYAGQLSLCQMAFGGVAAYLAAVFSIQAGAPLWLAMILAIVATIIIGVIVAIPVIRTRGSNLAIVTLALATVIDQLVINNTWATHVIAVGTLPDLRLFGADFNGLFFPRSYAVLVFVVFVAATLVVANLRRSGTGRRLLAVRGNERAAAAMGISVPGAKLYAFGVAAGVAATAGVLLEAQFTSPDFSFFTVLGSIDTALYAVLGGVGWASGAPVGAIAAPSGVGAQVLSQFFNPSGWLDLITGLSVIIVVLQSADGLVPFNINQAKALWRRIRPSGSASGRPASGRPAGPAVSKLGVSDEQRRDPALVEVRGLTVRFGAQLALDQVDVDIRPGEIVGLIGPNGAGKSTFIDVVSGFQQPLSGTVLVDGKPVDRLGPSRRASLGLSRSFQSLELFEDMTVLDNLRVSPRRQAVWRYVSDLLWPRPVHLSPAIAAAIRDFGLEPVLDRLPGQLDYARRRIVAIARAVSISPTVLFLDEPAAGLDETERREFTSLLKRLCSDWGIGILLVEHDVDLVFEVCDRVVALDAGRVIARGRPQEIRNDPALIASYLGAPDDSVPESEQVREIAL
jgi:ABC-type branched-subunit amino acid transport system ATPase component/branched-subunit amino acid ABC-type transport system permease component